jgi:hypothetical protein
VSGPFIAVEHVFLVVGAQDLFELVDVFSSWIVIVVAEDAEQRSIEMCDQIGGSAGLCWREGILRGHDVPAPTVDDAIDSVAQSARGQIGVTTT